MISNLKNKAMTKSNKRTHKRTKPNARLIKAKRYNFNFGKDVQFITQTVYPNIWLNMEPFSLTVLWTEFDQLVNQELFLNYSHCASNADRLRLMVCYLGVTKNQDKSIAFKTYHFKAFEQMEYGGGASEYHDPDCPLDRITAAAVCAAQTRELLKQSHKTSMGHQKSTTLLPERQFGEIHDNSIARKLSSFALDISKYVSMTLPRESKIEFNHLFPEDTLISPELYVYSITTFTDFNGVQRCSKIDAIVLYEAPTYVMPDISTEKLLQALTNPEKTPDFYQIQMIRQVVNYMTLHDVFVGIIANDTHVRFIAKPNANHPLKDGRHGGSIWISRALPKHSVFSCMNDRSVSVFGYISALVSILLRSKDMGVEWPGKGVKISVDSSSALFEAEMYRLNNEELYAEKFDTASSTASHCIDFYKFNQHLVNLEANEETVESVDKTFNQWKAEKLAKKSEKLDAFGKMETTENIANFEMTDNKEKANEVVNIEETDSYESELDESIITDLCSYFSSLSMNVDTNMVTEETYKAESEPKDDFELDSESLYRTALEFSSEYDETFNDAFVYDEESDQLFNYSSDGLSCNSSSISQSISESDSSESGINFVARRSIQNEVVNRMKSSNTISFTGTQRYFTKNGINTGVKVNSNLKYLPKRGITDYEQLCAYSNYNSQKQPFGTQAFRKMLGAGNLFNYGLSSCDKLSRAELYYFNNNNTTVDFPLDRGSFAITPELIFHDKISVPNSKYHSFSFTMARANDSPWFGACQNQEYFRDYELNSGVFGFSYVDTESGEKISRSCEVIIKSVQYKYSLESSRNNRVNALYNEVSIYRHVKLTDPNCDIIPQIYLFGDVWKTSKVLLMKPWGRKLHAEDLKEDKKGILADRMKTALRQLHLLNIILNFISLDAFGIDPKGRLLIVDLKKAYIVKKSKIADASRREIECLELLINNVDIFSGHIQLSSNPEMYKKSEEIIEEHVSLKSASVHSSDVHPSISIRSGNFKMTKKNPVKPKSKKMKRYVSRFTKILIPFKYLK